MSGGAWLRALLLAAVAGLALLRGQAPPVPDAPGPVDGLDLERALADLAVVAAEPHPTGSPGGARVREFLLARLEGQGLAPQTQRGIVQTMWGTPREVTNILVRVPGRAPSGVLMVAAHHDSAFRAPGAGDDGAAVVAILECLRWLRERPPLRNDVVFLLTDGEEQGLCGARLFVDEHPWASDIDVVLNFEARGSSGPTLMFETSPDAGWLVAHYAAVAPRPAANSMMSAVYRRMPNDTDFTIFRRAGIAGLGFAFIGGYRVYHTPEDDLAHLDAASLDHHLTTMAALVARLGEADLDDPPAGELAYVDVLGLGLLRWPLGATPLLAALAAGLLLAGLALALRRGRAKTSELLRGLGVSGATLLVAPPLGLALTAGVLHLDPSARLRAAPGTTADPWIFAALLLLTGLVAWAATRRLARGTRPLGVLLGTALPWLLLLAPTLLLLPEAGFLLLLPLAGLGLGALLALLAPAGGGAARLLAALGLVPALVLCVPLTVRLMQALTLERASLALLLAALPAASLPTAILPVRSSPEEP